MSWVFGFTEIILNINYGENFFLFKLFKYMATRKIAPLQESLRLKHDNFLELFRKKMTSKYLIPIL